MTLTKWTLREMCPLTLGLVSQGGGVVLMGRAAFPQELSLYTWTRERVQSKDMSLCVVEFLEMEKKMATGTPQSSRWRDPHVQEGAASAELLCTRRRAQYCTVTMALCGHKRPVKQTMPLSVSKGRN